MRKIFIFFICISLFSLLVVESTGSHCLASKNVKLKEDKHKACFLVSKGHISDPLSKVLGQSSLLYVSLAVTFVLTVIGGVFSGLFASRLSASGYYLINGFIMIFVYLVNRFIVMLKSYESKKSSQTVYEQVMSFIYPNSNNSGTGVFDRGLRPIFEANVIILSLYMILCMTSLKRHIIILVFTAIFFFLDMPKIASFGKAHTNSLREKVFKSSDFFAFMFVTIFYSFGIDIQFGSGFASENEQPAWYSPLRLLSFIFGFAHGTFISGWLLIEAAHSLETVEMNKPPNHLISVAMWLLQPKQLLNWLNILSPMLHGLGSDESAL